MTKFVCVLAYLCLKFKKSGNALQVIFVQVNVLTKFCESSKIYNYVHVRIYLCIGENVQLAAVIMQVSNYSVSV